MSRFSSLLGAARFLLPHGAVRLLDRWQSDRDSRNCDPQFWQGQPIACPPDDLHFDCAGDERGCIVAVGNETRVALVAQSGRTYRLKQGDREPAYIHFSFAAESEHRLPHDIQIYVDGRRIGSIGGRLEAGRWTTLRWENVERGRVEEIRLEFEGAGRLYLANPIVGTRQTGHRSHSKNIVVVIADSLRPVNVGCMCGHSPAESLTPNIDRFFANGRIWRNAFTQGEWTMPSVASMALGVYASQHGVYVPKEFQRSLPRSIPTVAELLHAAGYRTYCASMGRRFLPTYGHYRGFDRFQFCEYTQPDADVTTIGKAVEFMEVHKQEPFFSFLHFFAAHPPYGTFSYLSDTRSGSDRWGTPVDLYAKVKKAQDPEALARMQELAPARIRQFDHNLQQLFSYLEQCGLLESTAVLLLSDHGRMYTKQCIPLLRPELAHVPLLMRDKSVQSGVETGFVEPGVDLAPTILELAGLPTPAHYSGRSLLPAAEPTRQAGLSESLYGNEYEAVLRTDRWCYVFRAPMDPQSGEIETSTGVSEWLFSRNGDAGVESFEQDRLGDETGVARQMRQHVLCHLTGRKRHFGPEDQIAA